jgi:hypothetical protein
MTTASYAVRRNQNLSRTATAMRMGPVSMSLAAIAIISVLALLYLTQITKTSVYGYKVSEVKAEQAKLTAQHQELQVEAARLQSVKNIRSSQAAAKLTPTKNVSFAK